MAAAHDDLAGPARPAARERAVRSSPCRRSAAASSRSWTGAPARVARPGRGAGRTTRPGPARRRCSGGGEAFGWDECPPTVAPCVIPATRTGPRCGPRRVWGRPIEIPDDPDRFVRPGPDPRWPLRMTRTITLEGATVVARYAAWTDADEPPRAVVDARAARARTRHDARRRTSLAGRWPVPLEGAGGRRWTRSSRSTPACRPSCTCRRRGPPGRGARRRRRRGRFDWDRAFAPVLGIWLDYGGWPAGAGRHQVDMEPTTCHDDLEAARGTAARCGCGPARSCAGR